jgi:hypothetical protein
MGEFSYFRTMTFQAAYSLFWLLLILPLTFGLAWYFYRGNAWIKTQSVTVQRVLPLLRGLGLFFLMVLLLKITLLLQQAEVERPALITLFDNSSSIKRFKDSASIAQKFEQLKNEINQRFGGRYDLYFYSIGKGLREGGEIGLNEDQSNHELAFKYLAEQFLNRNVGAVLFASDGNYNSGDNPCYAAEQLSLTPIITLGVGDTTPKRDQIIGNLYHNDVVFLNDVFPLEVDLEAYKIKNTKAVVRLTNNGKILEQKTVNYGQAESSFQQLKFQVTAERTGFQAYTVSVEYLDGEYSKSNNTKTCYVEVIDTKNSIFFLASSPHPDLSAMRAAAETHENYEIQFLTPQELVQKNQQPDLLIWHGPNLPNDQKAFDFIKQNKLPVLFIIPGNVSNGTIKGLALFNLSNQKGALDEVQGASNPGFSSFELSEDALKAVELFPPLLAKFGNIAPNGDFETLLYQKIGNTVKKEPMFYFNKRGNINHGLIFGEGLWKWRLVDYMKNKNHHQFNEIFLKAYTYLLIKREGMGLSVQFDKRFSKNDRITVNANFYNASLEPITTPKISLVLNDNNGKKYAHQFNILNNGYTLDLGSLSPGKYHWKARTRHQSKDYSKEGDFLVEDISLERSVNAANHGVLKQLAKQSAGNYYPITDYSKALDSLEKRSDITSIERITTEFWDLVDSWFLLLLIALCFFVEWFLKRYFGAY